MTTLNPGLGNSEALGAVVKDAGNGNRAVVVGDTTFDAATVGEGTVLIGGNTGSAKNLVTGDAAGRTVVGGSSNSAADVVDVTILGGTGNSVSAATGTAVGGSGNAVSAANGAAVGGSGNTVSAAGGAIVGGTDNAASAANATAHGTEAAARYANGLTQGAGAFAVAGDAQTSAVTLKTQTADATPVAMSTIVVPNYSTVGFDIMVVGRRADAVDESAFYRFEGAIDRNADASTTALVAAVVAATPIEDTAGWACAVTADATGGGILITVTGAASTDINWLAFARLIEVTTPDLA